MSSEKPVRRLTFYSASVWAETQQARNWHTAAWAAKTWQADAGLIRLYRRWMRHHALEAVRKARAVKVA